MSESDLRPDVRRLIDRYLTSIDQVEMLLCIYNRTGERMDPHAVGLCVSKPLAAVKSDLVQLYKRGFLTHNARDGSYAYSVRDPAIDDAVAELARLYEERPLTLVRALQERPSMPVQSFADAFRLRRD